MHESAVSAVCRHELCYFKAGAFRENNTVKHTVDKVARSTGQDQRTADQQTFVVFFLHQFLHIDKTEHHRDQAEERQCDFAELTAKLQSICHALILDEMNEEPVGDHR